MHGSIRTFFQSERNTGITAKDISGNTMIFVDPGKFYPQHNIYYIAGGSIEQLQLLSAMLMSAFFHPA